ncbi:MAG: sucrase ferredoxin [Propionibacteriaceae bacterium]|nr:sucrase ferredoxin [Propionibacteriaceae bacterium]
MVRCSMEWSRADLPAWGTAARANFYVCLEIPGPWGPKAITDARLLDPVVGAELDAAVQAAGGRLVLIRHPERRTIGSDPLAVLVSGGFADGGWLRRYEVADPREVLARIPEWSGATEAGAGVPEGPDGGAAMLVCSHAKRDQCCALAGRPILAALTREVGPESIWEASHLGGHRFAPTMLLLPTGQVLGRLNAVAAVSAFHAAAEHALWPGGPRKDRGRSHLPPQQQAAEAWALAQFGGRGEEPLPDTAGVTLAPVPAVGVSSELLGENTVRVKLGVWEACVDVEKVTADGEAPVSCGKEPEPLYYWRVQPSVGDRAQI